MRKMRIKDEFKGKTVIIYNSVLGNQSVLIDKILPKQYEWYFKNGLKHIFEAEETVEEIVGDTIVSVEETENTKVVSYDYNNEIQPTKKTRTKKK